MRKILCAGPVLALLLALAGCCANDVCICQDELADALLFKFELGGPTGFRPSQVDTFFIVRITYPRANSPVGTAIVRDSVLRVLPLVISASGDTTIAVDKNSVDQNSIVINNAAPFASAGSTTKLNAYDYRINVYQTISRGGRRTTRRIFYLINNIQLAGENVGRGCCTCYTNTAKQFDLSRTTQPAQAAQTHVVTAPPTEPIVTLLTR